MIIENDNISVKEKIKRIRALNIPKFSQDRFIAHVERQHALGIGEKRFKKSKSGVS